MNGKLADRVFSFEESQTLEMAKKARELAATGIKVINLSLGEPDFNTPNHIIDAAILAMKNGFTKYPPVSGFLDLKQAIIKKFKTDNQLNFNENQIVVSTGAKHSIMNVILSIINPGDEVIVPCPYWVSYSEMIKFAGGIPVFIKSTAEQGFKFDISELESKITSKTKAFLFSSPNNPSGAVFNKDETIAIAQVFKKYPDIIVISDEIYEHLNYEHKHISIGSLAIIDNQTVTVNGVAKAYAMTGWRIGYIGAPEYIAKACEKIQGQFTSGANSIAQKATIEALNGIFEPTLSMKETFNKRRKLAYDLLSNIPGVKCKIPEGAFYLFPDMSTFLGKYYEDRIINSSRDLCYLLLEKAHVSMVSGEAFGNPECIRLSYAASDDDIKTAIQKVKDILLQLK